MRAERHSNSNFSRSLRHRISDDAVNADGGENHRDAGKAAEQQHIEFRLGKRGPDELRQRGQAGEINVAVHFMNRIAGGCLEPTQFIECGTQDNVHPTVGILFERDIKFGDRFDRERFVSGVANDADNFKRGGFFFLRNVEENVFSERIAVVEEFSDERFVHHHHSDRIFVVPRRECPAGQERNVHRAEVIAVDGEMRSIGMIAYAWIRPTGDPKR